MKNREILKLVSDHLKTKKMRKHAVKRLLYLLIYVPDHHKTQEMCGKAILEYCLTLKSLSYCYENQ